MPWRRGTTPSPVHNNMGEKNRKLQGWLSYLLISLGTVLLLVALWFALTPHVLPELVFPSPASVWSALKASQSTIGMSALYTLSRVLVGWGVGVTLGVLVGLLMTSSNVFFYVSNPLIEMVRPIPPIALIPFFITWFGIDNSGQLVLIALGGFMVMAVNTFVAIKNLPSIYIRAAAALGAPKRQIYRTVIIPAILPSLTSGLRIAAALAFGTAIAAEFMGAQSGLGFMIMVARRTLNTPSILLATIIIGLESLAFDLIIRAVMAYFTRWNQPSLDTIQELRARS